MGDAVTADTLSSLRVTEYLKRNPGYAKVASHASGITISRKSVGA